MFEIFARERMPWKFTPCGCSVSWVCVVSTNSTNEERKKRAERENDIYIYIRSSRLVLGLC